MHAYHRHFRLNTKSVLSNNTETNAIFPLNNYRYTGEMNVISMPNAAGIHQVGVSNVKKTKPLLMWHTNMTVAH